MSFTPEYERSESKVVGVWRLDRWALSSPQASLNLKELKSELGEAPLTVFESDVYPLAGDGVLGKAIPIGFGIVKGAEAFPIDVNASLFKIVNHSVESFQDFYTADGDTITPDVIDLGNGEFTYLAWDGNETLLADFTAEGENPVDCIKLLLTDSVKGANLPLGDLDTSSTGNKGFGVNGARNEYIYGVDPQSGDDGVEFPIGLYIEESKEINKWIQEVSAAAFAIVYVDITGKYQIKAWKPEVSEDLDTITDANIRGSAKTDIIASDVITRVISKYSENHGLEDFQTFTFEDDRLRQLRSLPQHKTLEQELPISTRFGARYWAQRTVAMRSVPRRVLTLPVTQETMLKEPGDYVRVLSERNNIDEVWEIISITINPGSLDVNLKLIDIRGFKEKEGFWTDDVINFPDRLGGALITQWDSSWTDEQKLWAKENLGFWCGDEDYIDVDNDPQVTYRGSVWS